MPLVFRLGNCFTAFVQARKRCRTLSDLVRSRNSSWSTDLGTAHTCTLPRSKAGRPSELPISEEHWGVYKERRALDLHKRYLFRGQNRTTATSWAECEHNHDLKDIFKGAAMRASTCDGPFRNFYKTLLAKGMRPTMARLTLARKIAAITLIVWKKGASFDASYLKQAA